MYSVITNCFNFILFITHIEILKYIIKRLLTLDSFKKDLPINSRSKNIQNDTGDDIQSESDFDDLTINKLNTINDPNNTDLLSPHRDVVLSALNLIISVLDDCQTIQVINDLVIENVLRLGNSKDEEILANVVEVISYITIIDDAHLKRYLYLQPSFKQVLLNIISIIKNTKIVTNALNSLCEMINGKVDTIKSIDGETLFNSALFILSKCNKKKFEQRRQPALILLSRCLCFFDAPEQTIINSTNEIRRFLNSKNAIIKPFIVGLINTISYYQPERILNYLTNELIQLIHLFTTNEFDSTQYAENLFGALSNMVYKSDEFSIFLPSSTPLFIIQSNEEWTEKASLNFMQLQETIFRRMRNYDHSDENWGKAILNIRNYTELIIMNSISFLNYSSFKVKKAAILTICQLIQIGDKTILTKIFSIDTDFVSLFIEYLDFNYELTYEIALTMLFLCRSSPINGKINVFNILLKADNLYVVQNIISDPEIDPDVLEIFSQIQKMLPKNSGFSIF